MTGPGVRFELDDGIGRITLARPELSNAIDLATARELGDCLTQAASPQVRAVLVHGEGARFCAGGDVASFAAADDRTSYMRELATVLEAQLRRLSSLAKPVVCAVHGAVAGAGLAVLLNSDVVVAGRSTKFVMAYPGIALTPDCGVSYLLPRAVGQQRALEFALTGRVLRADDAREWGLVTEVVDDDAVTARGLDVARALAAGPTHALAEAKRLIRSSWETARDAHARDEIATVAAAGGSQDAAERIATFVTRG